MVVQFAMLTLIIASIFSGAALYINIVEQPARLQLDDRPLLLEWKVAYKRGFAMQAPLALLGFLLGLVVWWQSDDLAWLIVALILVANWPFTIFMIMPTNNLLMKMSPAEPDSQTRRLIEKWGRLHAVRSALGLTAITIMLWDSFTVF